ncbi:DUF3060 domain-containing protein [Mycobacterium hodleri]|uniref:DUF3060 domain-containing protein n=1 Tax=Mycolicibacterium hodleri TaxID=49897 RepID=UPI0021F26078|nr:DUF3060 domain-containing protein [Mycolicibacterium hodleri]MCV7131703.1 DUF3060 domain-containing protein [Mycolicibacterium hodleri]
MRARSLRLASVMAAVAAAGVTGLAGCADSGSPTVTAGSTGVQVEIANTINYGSVGTTAEIDCAHGKSLTVGGSNNTLTVKGTCTNVNVGGADNRLTFDEIVDALTVVGLNNTVSYANGQPKVNDTGSGNAIRKG